MKPTSYMSDIGRVTPRAAETTDMTKDWSTPTYSTRYGETHEGVYHNQVAINGIHVTSMEEDWAIAPKASGRITDQLIHSDNARME